MLEVVDCAGPVFVVAFEEEVVQGAGAELLRPDRRAIQIERVVVVDEAEGDGGKGERVDLLHFDLGDHVVAAELDETHVHIESAAGEQELHADQAEELLEEAGECGAVAGLCRQELFQFFCQGLCSEIRKSSYRKKILVIEKKF